ncbi:MAG: AAA family ATPase [Spirulinaceae cyanobacterium]
MAVIALVNQKGGCGKSTTAVHFAYYLARRGTVALVDADSQQSSSIWIESIEDDSLPYAAILDPEELFESIERMGQEYDAVVVDGPGSLSEVTKTILDCSDIALMPCQPSGLDLSSSGSFLRIIRHRQKIRGGKPKVGLFLSRAVKGTVLLKEAKEALQIDERFPLLETIIYQRQCLADASIQKSTAFDLSGSAAKAAAKGYESLFEEALKLLG